MQQWELMEEVYKLIIYFRTKYDVRSEFIFDFKMKIKYLLKKLSKKLYNSDSIWNQICL